MVSSRTFDYFVSDPNSALTKVRVVGPCVTLYFNEKDFDQLPSLRGVDGFSFINEKNDAHHFLHIDDNQQNKAHIHFKANGDLFLTPHSLAIFFRTLLKSQTQATNTNQSSMNFFVVKPFFTVETIKELLEKYLSFYLECPQKEMPEEVGHFKKPACLSKYSD